MQKTAARSQTNTAPAAFPGSSAKGDTEELPPLSGRLLVPRSLYVDAGHEPTETEVTETTERTGVDGDIKSVSSGEEEHQVGKTSPAYSYGSLLPLCDLIDRLARVNQQEEEAVTATNNVDIDDGTLPRRRPVAAGGSSNDNDNRNQLMDVEDLTAILRHVNLSEASESPIRWDLIQQQTEGVLIAPAASDDRQVENMSMSNMSGAHSSPEATTREVIFMLENEDFDEKSTGFSLEPTSHSCSSSVTWYEGSLFEEVEIPSDDEDLLARSTAESQSWDS